MGVFRKFEKDMDIVYLQVRCLLVCLWASVLWVKFMNA